MSDIPAPPEAYIAHPYTLLQAGRLIGRQTELNELTEWVTEGHKPVFNAVAIGGMGKSALTWHWFNRVALLEMKLTGTRWPPSGRVRQASTCTWKSRSATIFSKAAR